MKRNWSAENDEQLHHLADVEAATGEQVIRIGIHSYNDGPPKLSLMRTGEKRDGDRWYRGLGRLALSELVGVLAVLDRFQHKLEKVGVLTDGVVSNKRFAKWVAAHGKPLPAEQPAKKKKKKDEDDEPDETPAKHRHSRVVTDDSAAPDEKPAKRKLKRPLPQR